jgi:hypothetical protein
MSISPEFRPLPTAEFVTEFVYPGEAVEGYESVNSIWNILAARPHSVFACFGCVDSPYEYLSQFGIAGVMCALPHGQLDYWTHYGKESGWCFQVPMDDARFLTDNIAHEQGCTLYLLPSELTLVDLASVLSETRAEGVRCLQRLLGSDDSILFVAANEFHSATTRRLQSGDPAHRVQRFELFESGEFAFDRIYPGAVIDWDGCFNEIWEIVASEPHAIIACVACSGPNDEMIANAGLADVVKGLPNRKVDYCTVGGINGGWCFQLPVVGAAERTRRLLATGAGAVFLLRPDMTLDDFANINAETRTDPTTCMQRLLTPRDAIVFATADRQTFELRRQLHASTC